MSQAKQSGNNQVPGGNQTEQEFFAVEAKGRAGVEQMLSTMRDEITTVAAPQVRSQYDQWAQRALLHVVSQDTLKPLLQTKQGLYSIYQELSRFAQLGLQIGGARYPHAYLVPIDGKATGIITAEGFAFAAAHGPGAVLKHVPEIVEVCENDDFRVDQANSTYHHEYNPFSDRGKIVGYVAKLVYHDGHVEIPTISRKKVEAIRDAYSRVNGPAWKKSPEEMLRSKAAKQLLRKPFSEAEGLAMLVGSIGEGEAPEPAPQQAPPRNVSERVASTLETRVDAVTAGGPADEPATTEAQPNPSEQPSEQQAGPDNGEERESEGGTKAEGESEQGKPDLDIF